MRNSGRLAVALVVIGMVVFGAWLRWPGMARGYTSDEMSMVQPWGFSTILFEAESGVNPPLLRLMFNLPFDEAGTLVWGRWWSFACSLLAIPLAYGLGQRAGRHPLSGLMAAGIVTTFPMAVIQASIFRSYATFLPLLCWHLWVAGAWLEGNRERVTAWQLAVSAFLLPQVHFVAVPILLAEALVLGWYRLRDVALLVPAAVGFAPFAVLILTEPARRVPPSESAWKAVQTVAGLGEIGWYSATAFVAAALLWRWLHPTQRLLVVGAMGLAASMVLFGSKQVVRPPGTLWMLPFFAGIVGSFAGLVPSWAGRWGEVPRAVVTVLLVWGLGRAVLDRYTYEFHPVEDRDQVLAFAKEWRSLAEAGETIEVEPAYFLPMVWFYLTGHHISKAPECQGNRPCFVHDGVRFEGVGGGDDHSEGLRVRFDCWPQQAVPAECSIVRDEECYTVARCSGVPAAGQ